MNSRNILLTGLVAAIACLPGCGGSSDGNSPPTQENRAPVADAGTAQTVGEAVVVTLDASASTDLDDDALTYSWSQSAGEGVTLSDDSTATPTFTSPAVDENTTLEFQVTVSDGEAESSDTVSVVINAAPTAMAGTDLTVSEGTLISLDGSGSSDPDDTLSYSWEQVSGPDVLMASADGAVYQLHAPDVAEITPIEFQLTVSDGVQSSSDTVTVEIHPLVLDASIAGMKTLQFGWDGFADAHHLRLQQNPDGASGFTTIVDDIPSGGSSIDLEIATHLLDWGHAEYLLEACLDAECSAVVATSAESIDDLDSLSAIGYVKALIPASGDNFGGTVVLSGDGSTLAVAATAEKGSGDSVNPADDGIGTRTGAVYVFRKGEAGWEQEAYVKASNSQEFDSFGVSIALSHDGNTLVVGAHGEDSNSLEINGDQANDLATASGAVYVYRRDGDWTFDSYIKAPNTDEVDFFGWRVALSADGNILAISAPNENGDTSSRPGAYNQNFGEAGAVYIYRHNGAEWNFSDYIKPDDLGTDDKFGEDIALSADGNVLVASTLREDGSGTGVNDIVNEDAPDSGAAYVFRFDGTATWTEEAYLKASNTEAEDRFGVRIALSADGSTVAVGADNEDGSGSGVNPLDDNDATSAGAVYIYRHDGLGWGFDAYVKLTETSEFDFLFSVALNGDGSLLAIGATGEDGGSRGFELPAPDVIATNSGAVELLSRDADGWRSIRFIKAKNAGSADGFGPSVSLDESGDTLAASAANEDSAATGVDGDGEDNNLLSSGAAYLY